MKRLIQILIFLFLLNQVTAQVNSRDLNGEWIISNYDGISYYESDTIELIQEINPQYELDTSSIVVWNIAKRNLSIHFINNQNKPSSILNYYENGKLKLIGKDNNQFIEIRKGRVIIELFKILSLEQKIIDKESNSNKILTLERLQNTKTNKFNNDQPPVWNLSYLFQFF